MHICWLWRLTVFCVHVCLLYVWFVCVLFVPSVLWYCWLGFLTCKNRLPYNLYCVGGDVKHCSIHSNHCSITVHMIALHFTSTATSTYLSAETAINKQENVLDIWWIKRRFYKTNWFESVCFEWVANWFELECSVLDNMYMYKCSEEKCVNFAFESDFR